MQCDTPPLKRNSFLPDSICKNPGNATPFSEIPDGQILAIYTPEFGINRCRKIATRSRSRPTGKYPSWKMNRMVQWESQHELNAYRLLDAETTVHTFYEQPFKIIYTVNGEQLLHYPDVLVMTDTGSEVWEIKPKLHAEKSDVLKRTALLTAFLPYYGYQYRMIYAEELTTTARLENAIKLLRYGRNDVSLLDRERLRYIVTKTPDFTWGAVLEGILGTHGRDYVCRLILEGVITFDFKEHLERDTPLAHVAVFK
jgi:hypothetical protein